MKKLFLVPLAAALLGCTTDDATSQDPAANIAKYCDCPKGIWDSVNNLDRDTIPTPLYCDTGKPAITYSDRIKGVWTKYVFVKCLGE